MRTFGLSARMSCTSTVPYCQQTKQAMREQIRDFDAATGIAMLLQPQHCELPLFDTTALHARSAALWALS